MLTKQSILQISDLILETLTMDHEEADLFT